MSTPLLSLDRISKIYPSGNSSIEALKEIDLVVRAGQFVALQGKSGSGKTTLLQLIAGLEWATSGRVLFNGRDLREMSKSELARMRGAEIGFVFQTFNLVPSLTALENVELPLLLQQVSRKERRARSTELLKRVEMLNRQSQHPATLSGGEKQRVAIARALAAEPPLILADEPTGNLDETSGAQVLALLGEIHATGKTLVLATHDSAAASQADKVIQLRDGVIVSQTASA